MMFLEYIHFVDGGDITIMGSVQDRGDCLRAVDHKEFERQFDICK